MHALEVAGVGQHIKEKGRPAIPPAWLNQHFRFWVQKACECQGCALALTLVSYLLHTYTITKQSSCYVLTLSLLNHHGAIVFSNLQIPATAARSCSNLTQL